MIIAVAARDIMTAIVINHQAAIFPKRLRFDSSGTGSAYVMGDGLHSLPLFKVVFSVTCVASMGKNIGLEAIGLGGSS